MTDRPISPIIAGLRDLPGMELLGIKLKPGFPRAVPISQKRDDSIHYLIGLRFETPAEAESFANGLTDHCSRDGQRVLFKRPGPPTTQDGQAIRPN
jgi:hypothetical protein